MGHAGVGWVIQGWGVSYRGGVGHTGVGGMIYVGWSGLYSSGVGHAGVGWVMQGWGVSNMGGVGHVGVGWGGTWWDGVSHVGWDGVDYVGVG